MEKDQSRPCSGQEKTKCEKPLFDVETASIFELTAKLSPSSHREKKANT